MIKFVKRKFFEMFVFPIYASIYKSRFFVKLYHFDSVLTKNTPIYFVLRNFLIPLLDKTSLWLFETKEYNLLSHRMHNVVTTNARCCSDIDQHNVRITTLLQRCPYSLCAMNAVLTTLLQRWNRNVKFTTFSKRRYENVKFSTLYQHCLKVG